MYRRDYRDLATGIVLLGVGLFVAWYCATRYRLGVPSQMGPGMFPATLGILLAGFGGAIACTAWFRAGPRVAIDARPALFVLLSIAAFAVTVRWGGLLPAIVLLVAVAGMADSKNRPVRVALLAAALGLLGVGIFRYLLGMPLTPLRWPF